VLFYYRAITHHINERCQEENRFCSLAVLTKPGGLRISDATLQGTVIAVTARWIGRTTYFLHCGPSAKENDQVCR
jgi:hypothetical protein